MEWYMYILIILAGMAAGIINTLAGNGSVITLSLLIFLGLPAGVANGTNRIGILFQNAAAVGTFPKSRTMAMIKKSRWLLIVSIVGAIVGALIAVELSDALMQLIIGVLMVLMLFIIVIKPKRWLRETDLQANANTPLNLVIFFLIGVYGGFIQMGMGIFFLAAIVLGARYSLIDGNLIKLIVVLIFTIPVLTIFILNDQVVWALGLILAIGQSIGAWLAARFALQHPKAAIWVHRLLIIMVIVAIIRVFNLHQYIL